MLSERSQTQKAIYCVILFICHFCKGKIIGRENKSAVGWGGKEEVEQFGGYAIVLYLDCCGGYKTKHLSNSELHIKKNFYCTLNYTSMNPVKKKKTLIYKPDWFYTGSGLLESFQCFYVSVWLPISYEDLHILMCAFVLIK